MTFNFSTPYASTRLPVFARNVVSTSHPLGAQAGLRILQRGGNAVDAAIATAAVMAIVEPVSNGLGSDAFCIIWDGKELHGLNASGRAPAAWTAEYFKNKYGNDAATPPKRGIDSVTVPGAVSSWVAMSEKFGKLPFADLMQSAIEIAERGYLLPIVVQGKWQAPLAEIGHLPGFAQSFLPHGRAPNVGELFKFPAAAKALRAIAATKGEAFYKGEIAAALEKFSTENGGSLTAHDMAAHTVDWVKPIAKNYRGHTLHEIPPNGQGIAALMALGILEHFDLSGMDADGVDALHGGGQRVGAGGTHVEADLADAQPYRQAERDQRRDRDHHQSVDREALVEDRHRARKHRRHGHFQEVLAPDELGEVLKDQ
mgnify:CR=1 FL=1